MKRKIAAVSLLELMVAMILLTLIVLALTSFEKFSRYHTLASDRRAKLQNELSYALEFMNKYITQGVGMPTPVSSQAIQRTGNGFRVRVDLNATPTPSNLADDAWVNFILNSNTLRFSCSGSGCPAAENLTQILLRNEIYSSMPSPLPSNPRGFYINITENGSMVDVGLVGRYNPATAASQDNPQVSMKMQMRAQNTPAR